MFILWTVHRAPLISTAHRTPTYTYVCGSTLAYSCLDSCIYKSTVTCMKIYMSLHSPHYEHAHRDTHT